MYGSGNWTLQKKHLDKLTDVELDFWRRYARKSRLEKIRNIEIRRIMEVESIVDLMERRRLKWYGYARRMEDTRIPRMVGRI